ncbi:choice-of-anchor Q domain-containing protein [Paenibacillus sp. M1]|uniref:Choice-of-anchor Q domain-containing protein n=1 Tax=Paenibacillus haidiansis TaxID=1574488 RepID=A0ABU7VSW6_9BACL
MRTLKRMLAGMLCAVLFLFTNNYTLLYMNGSNKVMAASGGSAYYVATTGNDNNPGTLSSPWKTLQKAAGSAKPGDTVYVRGGVYNEFVNFKVSGTATGPITFQNYEQEIPIVDGSGLSLAKNQALMLLSNVSYITISGFEIRNLSTSSSSYDPAGIRVKDGGSRIQLLNNNVHHIENTSKSGNGHGIHVLGNSSTAITDLIISGNQVHHLKTGKSESLTLSGNINGFSITGNKVYDNNNIGIELAGFYGACSGSCTDQTRNGTVAENIVYLIDSSDNIAYGTGIHAAGGIYADGARDIVIERNEVYNSDFGIELASEKKGKNTSGITVRNNYLHHNYGAGLIMGGASSSNGGSAQNTILNNTFIENDTLSQGYGDITLQWNNADNRFFNNILYSGSQKLSVNKINSSGSGNVFDYNLFYNSVGTAGSQWKWNGKSYSWLAAYKQATGNEEHGLYGNPLFANKAYSDIRLKAGSPAIDKGSPVSAGTYDLSGAARVQGSSLDIGAMEYAPSSTDPPTVPTDPTAPSSPGITVDGDAADWNGIAALATGTGKAQSLKAVKDAASLNVLVQGSELTAKGQLFFNTDSNANTGFKASYWKTSGADYLLENGRLYRYGGSNGTAWKWTLVKDYTKSSSYSVSDSILEAAVPLTDLGKLNQTSPVTIGYVWKDSNQNKLPASGNMLEAKDTLE